MWQIIQVDERRAEALEPLGTKYKFWFTALGRQRMLFKADDRGTGEDWAEKIACELCRLLGLPHVHYELAVESSSGKPGVVCETCAPPPTALILGNQLLVAIDRAYPARVAQRYKVPQHTVDAVAAAVGELKPPPAKWTVGMPSGIDSASGVFAGYIMLDAWIANQDRHHENWAALLVDGSRHLAPTFDHGASLARNLTDDERRDRLTSRDRARQVGHFARRAKSAFYAEIQARHPMTTVEAWRAFVRAAPAAANIWEGRLRAIQPGAVSDLLAAAPPERMSRLAREFTERLLEENRQRILNREDV